MLEQQGNALVFLAHYTTDGLSTTGLTVTVDAQHIPALWIVGRTWVNNVNATITSRSSHSAADVWASATRTLTSFGTLVADIWASATRTLTMTAQSILAAIADGEVAQQRGDQGNIP